MLGSEQRGGHVIRRLQQEVQKQAIKVWTFLILETVLPLNSAQDLFNFDADPDPNPGYALEKLDRVMKIPIRFSDFF